MTISPLMMMKLAKYGSLKMSDLTGEHVREISSIIGLDVPEDKVNGLLGVLHTGNSDTLVDWISVNGNAETIREFLKPGQNGPMTIKCPHCQGFFSLATD